MTHIPANPNALQTYQVALYQRALHPELFTLRDRRTLRHADYEFEAWLMPAGHVLRFERGGSCVCELVTEREEGLPEVERVEAFFAAGEHEYERCFKALGINYMTNVQTEQLSENIYLATLDEMRQHAVEMDALAFEWEDDEGHCLSIVDVQRFSREVHAQCYHLLARGGVVVRTQSIFERT